MKHAAVAVLIGSSLLFTSCQDIMTTSLGKGLARTVSISSDMSLDDILALSAQYPGNVDIAKSAYDALQEKLNTTPVADLSMEDRTDIIALSLMSSDIENDIITALQSVMTDSEDLSTVSNETISTMLVDLLNDADTSVASTDLFVNLLSDPATLTALPQETAILAAAVTAAQAINSVVDVSTIAAGTSFEDVANSINDSDVDASGATDQFILAANILQYAVSDGTTPVTPITAGTSTADILSTFTNAAADIPDSVSSLLQFSDTTAGGSI